MYSVKIKEYAFASALMLNNYICVYFLIFFIRFSVAYERWHYLKYPGTTRTTSEFDNVEIVQHIKLSDVFYREHYTVQVSI